MNRTRALMEILLIYVSVALVGLLTYRYAPTLGLASLLDLEEGFSLEFLDQMLVADLAMTALIYVVSVAKRNSSAYDAYWSVIPFYFIVAFALNHDVASWGWPQWGAALLVSAWSWRLTLNWVRGWSGWDHEDWRYMNFRESHGRAFELTNFFGIHLFPTLIVFAGCVGLFWVYQPMAYDPVWHALGLAVGFLGVWLEFVADNELARFRHRENPTSEEILDTGIWGRLRYPNYLGEMLFWFGVCFCGFGAGAPWLTAAGAVSMVALFVFASIPMKEERMASRKPAFKAYCQRVPALLPRFRNR